MTEIKVLSMEPEEVVVREKTDETVVSRQNGDFEVKIENPEIPLITHGLWTRSKKGQESRLHTWRTLDGNFNYPFNGKYIRGPRFPYTFIILLFHLSCSLGLFYGFEIKQLFIEENTELCCMMVVLSLLCFSFLSFNGFRVITTDPGYIERPVWETRMDNFINYHVDKIPGIEYTKEVEVDGETEIYKFCITCCNYRPPKTEHCEVCDCCIERYDHYSKFFGTSIGKRNIGYYIKFLFFVNFLFNVILTGACIVFYENIIEHGWKYGLLHSPTSYMILLAALYPPFPLITFPAEFIKQMFYFSIDQTKNEWLNKHRSNTSICTKLINLKNNIHEFLCKSPSESKIDPHKIVTEKVIPRPLKKIGEMREVGTPVKYCKTQSKPDSKFPKCRILTSHRKSTKVEPANSIRSKTRKQRNPYTLPSALQNSDSVSAVIRRLQIEYRLNDRGMGGGRPRIVRTLRHRSNQSAVFPARARRICHRSARSAIHYLDLSQ